MNSNQKLDTLKNGSIHKKVATLFFENENKKLNYDFIHNRIGITRRALLEAISRLNKKGIKIKAQGKTGMGGGHNFWVLGRDIERPPLHPLIEKVFR